MKLRTLGIVLCVGALAGCAKENKPASPEPAPAPRAAAPSGAVLSGTVGENTAEATAKVVKIDHKTRKVTLQRPDKSKFDIVVSPEVHNLPQVKKGDTVRITYKESVAYEVQKAGSAKPGAAATSSITRAAPGEKPGGTVTDTVTVRMTIVGIDKANSEASLRDPNGKVTTVKVKDPSKLDVVKVGDLVDITYTEALAIAVEKTGK